MSLIYPAKKFKGIIDSINEIISESFLIFTPEALLLKSFNISRNCAVELKIASDDFQEYNVTNRKDVFISIDNLKVILNCCGDKDTMQMNFESEDDLGIKLSRSQFNLALKNSTDDEEIIFPEEVLHTHKFTIGNKEFTKIIKNINSMGEVCEVTVDNGTISFGTKGDIGKANIVAETVKMITESDQVVKSKYDVKYLLSISKCGLSDQITVYVSEENPICFEYPVSETFNDTDVISFVRFYLAPKDNKKDDD
jgi:proliferating cell nuclear antigen